ncbi:SpaA isopeptide-forming pilin-related protein [Pseudoflavonifractor phocaeensis]|uniref:SpaA isopeptide-forming pilin-related protein n=1 Tax=Pseudoflavonifractor phocaeensis TaxID=1870988 RepID=UPI002109CF1D|nr:SpaA isopeptide-forming pilin-related protein [Pseudoflavonifractor phocaeensis]MCQ4864959.1 SpaA isopeptide-forming pilin-related protein [Pseudoflavonifractor phocaeensis]
MKYRFWDRALAMLLALALAVTLCGVMPGAQAASIVDTLKEADIYNGDFELTYLAMNGAVQKQLYTYYNFRAADGSMKEIPAYCVSPNQYGVPQTVEPGESIKYTIDKVMSDPKAVGIICNGYPHQSLEVLGLSNKYQAFYATKMALWTYLIPSWSLSGLTVNPSLTGSERDIAENLLSAARRIYVDGTQWSTIPQPSITVTPETPTARAITIEGQEYLEQDFSVHSETWVGGLSVKLSFALPADAAAMGAKITDMSNKEITQLPMEITHNPSLSTGSYDGKYKVLVPKENVDQINGTLEVNLAGEVFKYELVYAICAEKDKYSNLQNYLLDTDPVVGMAVKGAFTPPGGGDGPDEPDTPYTSIRIVKLEEGTKTPLAGAVFEVVAPDGAALGSYCTGTDGTVTIPVTQIGHYTITETTPPRYHLLSNEPTQHVTATYGQVATVTFTNAPYGELRIEKIDSANGGGLAGANIQIKHIESGTTYTQVTGPGGAAQFTQLRPGAYKVLELTAPEGWQRDPQAHSIVVKAGETVSYALKNDALPGLKIIKYDSQSHTTMSHVTFEIFRDGVSLGQFETDALGEITLTNQTPGTYRVVEVDTGDTGHIIAPPQEIELTAGVGIKTMYFFNDTKPGMWLVKVDSADPSRVIPNAVFTIRAIDGSFGPKEYTTDRNGEIDLSELPTGSYEVLEKSCPGYIVDKAQRIIHLEANTTARFVFTNSMEPSLHLIKLSADGTPMPGVSFRIARIEDGSHYLDRVTDQNGEILISGLEAGVYSVVETATKPDHILDATEHHVELFAGKTSTIVLNNNKKPNLVIHKADAVTGNPIEGTTFLVKYADNTTITTVETDENGEAMVENLDAGRAVQVIEQSVPDPYLLDAPPQLITLEPNRTGHVYFQNHPKPAIDLTKVNADGESIPGAVFTVAEKSGRVIGDYEVGEDGHLRVYGLRPGFYVLTEKSVPAPYILDRTPHEVELKEGRITELTVENHRKPTLTIHKRDSITGDPIQGARFQIWAAVNESLDGELKNLGIFTSDENGEIHLEEQDVGWVRVTELESAPGYAIKEPATQDIFLYMDTGVQVTFRNVPLSALIVYKYDQKTGEALEGAVFEVKYLGGTSGTGGTVIGTYKTSANGSFVVTGLKAGTYVVSELRSSPHYSIDTAPQTAYLSGKEQDVVTLYFGNQPHGSVLIKKLTDDADKAPLEGAVFLVMDDTGAVIGNANGEFTTDKSGAIQLPKLPAGTTVVAKEIRAPEGYALDGTPQTVRIKAGETHTLTFYDKPLCNLTVLKRDSVTKQPLAGADFLITDGAGAPIGENNGRYTSGSDGLITLSGLTPGQTVIVREEKAPAGYVIDGEPKSITLKSGKPNSLTFDNAPKGTLIIVKQDGETKKPLAGATFQVTTSTGEYVPNAGGAISSNGMYTTDATGKITITGLEPSTLVVTETVAPDGYVLDGTPQTVVVQANDVQTLTFYNTPTNTLTIQKYMEGTSIPIQGVTFLVTDSSGAVVGPNNGEYITDRNGRISIPGLAPGTTITARETKSAGGYVLDGTPQSILIKEGEAQQITFFNKAEGGLELTKVREDDRSTRIPNVEFQIHRMDGGLVGTYTTDKRGRFHADLEAGNYYALEVYCPKEYKLDYTPRYFTVADGKTTELRVTNKAFSGILIHKIDSTTGKGVPNVTFLLYDRNMNPLDQFVSDQNGYAYIDDLGISGKVYLRELEAEGYIVDQDLKTVYVRPGETTEVVWKNTPIMGQIQIIKKSADDNPINGLPAGTPLEGARFEIYDKAGNVVDTIVSGSNGLAVSKPLPLSRYTVREIQAPAYYAVNEAAATVYLEYSGQIVRLEVLDKSVNVGVSISKTGPKEAVSNQPVRYVFSGIANTGNTPLDSFYWRDTLPVEVRLNQVVTGTYNKQLNYKIVYKTSAGGDYRTLADNLSTRKLYTLDASPAALGLAANERVTEIMFVFGRVAGGFAQVETPMLNCTTVPGLTGGRSFTNVAEAGGVYNKQWVQAVTRWVTTVYGQPVPLPRTGY